VNAVYLSLIDFVAERSTFFSVVKDLEFSRETATVNPLNLSDKK
jgi:hypothetical protein